MTALGLCTHFSETDDLAFDYAFALAQKNGWQLNICHWLHSPYRLRRDLVQDPLLPGGRAEQATPQLLVRLEQALREHYETRLGEFTDVAFKLCEGFYQVELVRCFRKNLLDLVVMGYQHSGCEPVEADLPLEIFVARLGYPVVLVGHAGPESFKLNQAALAWLPQLVLAPGSWELLQPEALAV